MKKLLILGMIGAVAMLGGCVEEESASAPMMIGKVDTSYLLQSDLDYQKLSANYVEEKTKFQQDFWNKMKDTPKEDREALALEFRPKEEAFNKKWSGITQTFIDEKRDRISGIVGKLAEQKKLDLVLIDDPQLAVIKWGGIDITQDVELSLLDNEKTSSGSESSTESNQKAEKEQEKDASKTE